MSNFLIMMMFWLLGVTNVLINLEGTHWVEMAVLTVYVMGGYFLSRP